MNLDPSLNQLPIGSKGVTRPPIPSEDSALVFFIGVYLVNMIVVIAHFTWQFLSMENYFGVPVVLLTTSFRFKPNYFP